MKKIRASLKPVSWLLAIFMILMVAPFHTVLANMVTTEAILDAGRVSDARTYVDNVLSREAVKAALVDQGIDPSEAMLRTHALSDAEILSLAEHMQKLPAGGGTFETVLIVLLIVFLVLLFTDIAGATDVFPFVKK
ncbi:MAG: PA2779 family protein [Desulfosarcina sp.]|jgi:hypothetical protein